MRRSVLRWLLQCGQPKLKKIPCWWQYMQERYGYQQGWECTTWMCIRDEVTAHPEMCAPDVKAKITAHVTRIIIDQEETMAEAHYQWWSGETIKTVCIDEIATLPMNLVEV